MDGEVPKEDSRDVGPREPLLGSKRAFEEREADLVEEINTLSQRGIPAGATVGEAKIEIERAMREDPDIRELIQKLLMMALYGGGDVVENWTEWRRENRPLD